MCNVIIRHFKELRLIHLRVSIVLYWVDELVCFRVNSLTYIYIYIYRVELL
ncbi:hypothetical protein HanIR_Chr01g0023581 [Helianthus annuus]|nr:hypothetical protein HanIR_Chr01g0023581 [Helianthus annuus]